MWEVFEEKKNNINLIELSIKFKMYFDYTLSFPIPAVSHVCLIDKFTQTISNVVRDIISSILLVDLKINRKK